MATLIASQIRSTFFLSGSLDVWTPLETGGGYIVFVTSSSLRTKGMNRSLTKQSGDPTTNIY